MAAYPYSLRYKFIILAILAFVLFVSSSYCQPALFLDIDSSTSNIIMKKIQDSQGALERTYVKRVRLAQLNPSFLLSDGQIALNFFKDVNLVASIKKAKEIENLWEGTIAEVGGIVQIFYHNQKDISGTVILDDLAYAFLTRTDGLILISEGDRKKMAARR